jgi:signal transduction histidine kinase
MELEPISARPEASGLSMDLGLSLAGFAVDALSLQAAAMLALAIALAAVVARSRHQTGARAARVAAENEALRDELWRLKEAAAARDRAEAANEAKSRFLATISHEMRTPISGILGMADLLREAALDAENASYLEAIRSSGNALIALIDEILDLSKIEAGHFDLVAKQGHRNRRLDQRRRPALRARGRPAPAPGAHQSRRQCSQVHR